MSKVLNAQEARRLSKATDARMQAELQRQQSVKERRGIQRAAALFEKIQTSIRKATALGETDVTVYVKPFNRDSTADLVCAREVLRRFTELGYHLPKELPRADGQDIGFEHVAGGRRYYLRFTICWSKSCR